MDINTILNELFNFRTKKRRKNIDDLKEIYALLGFPCQNSKIIHVAGTNGKGSTVTFIENILFANGFRVGKFTSPHIQKFNERIIFNKQMISDDEIIKYYQIALEKIKKYSSKKENLHPLNFFEITFFICLLFFNEKNPDFIVIETGLGGRMDATNLINSDIAAITNISLEHTNILGNSLKEIAFEKAGIIKKNELCLFSQNLPELIDAINERTENSINLIEKYHNMKVILDKKNYKTIVTLNNYTFEIPLFGKFQANNFLIAYEIAKIYNIEDKIIQKGLDDMKWIARFEFVSKNPPVILDAAHNEDSIKTLLENLNELYKKDEVIFITSVLETKNFKKIFEKLETITNKIFITSLSGITYGLNSEEIKSRMIKENIPIHNITFENDIKIAYNKTLELVNQKNTSYKAIVICGSFYEIAKFKNLIG